MRGCFCHPGIPGDELKAASSLERSILIRGVVKEILERLEQERPKAATAVVRLSQPVSFQNHQEKILRNVLRVLIRIAAAADVGKSGSPVGSAKFRQRLSRLLLVAPGIRSSKDQAPTGGGEHPWLGFHVHRPIASLFCTSSTSLNRFMDAPLMTESGASIRDLKKFRNFG